MKNLLSLYIYNVIICNSIYSLKGTHAYALFPYLQYKFIVDGEWRHDERQPFVSSNFGIVNTILLARESDYILPGSNMDVDNEAFQNLVRVGHSLVANIVVLRLKLFIPKKFMESKNLVFFFSFVSGLI